MKCIYLYRHDDVRHTIEEKKMQHVCAVGSDSTYKIHVPFHGPSSSGARVTRENLKPECFSCTLDSGCGGIHLVYFSLGTASLWSVVSPLARTHRHLRFHKAGAPHPRPQEGRPPPAHGPRLAPCVSRGVPTRRAAPRAAETRFLWLGPRVHVASMSVSIANLPGSNQGRIRDHLPSPPRGRSPAGGPGSSTATRTLPEAAPTGARAAAGSGAGAAAPAPFGSGRRHGRSSLPEPAGRERGRPGPGGSEAPAAAAFPARKPLQGRRQGWAEGEAAGQCRGNTVPPESER